MAVRIDSLPAIEPPPSSVRLRRAITLDSSYAPSLVDTLLFSDASGDRAANGDQQIAEHNVRANGNGRGNSCATHSKSVERDLRVAPGSPGSPSVLAAGARSAQFAIVNAAFARGSDLMDLFARVCLADQLCSSSPLLLLFSTCSHTAHY